MTLPSGSWKKICCQPASAQVPKSQRVAPFGEPALDVFDVVGSEGEMATGYGVDGLPRAKGYVEVARGDMHLRPAVGQEQHRRVVTLVSHQLTILTRVPEIEDFPVDRSISSTFLEQMLMW